MQEVIKDFRRFLAKAQSAIEESRPHIPHEMLAVPHATDDNDLTIHEQDARRLSVVVKLHTQKIPVQPAHHGGVTGIVRRTHATVGAPIEDVTIVETYPCFPAAFLDPK